LDEITAIDKRENDYPIIFNQQQFMSDTIQMEIHHRPDGSKIRVVTNPIDLIIPVHLIKKICKI
jgi:hypothetical protein